MANRLPNVATATVATRGRRGGLVVSVDDISAPSRTGSVQSGLDSRDSAANAAGEGQRQGLLPPLALRRKSTLSQKSSSGSLQSSCSESSITGQRKPTCMDSDIGLATENQLTNEKLQELYNIFEEADEDGGGGLDMDEFRIAMRKAMGDGMTDHELDLIFMKVDTNCDGTVDWDEYLSYMLLEYREKDLMNLTNAIKPFPNTLRMVPNMNRYQRFHDSIIKVNYMPNVIKFTNALYKAQHDTMGRYITVTKEGVVNLWSTELSHQRTFSAKTIPHYKRNVKTPSGSTWVTDMVTMSNANMVAVTNTSATVNFYDMQVQQFQLAVTITDLETCATCMHYWYHEDNPSHAILVWGDARGNICAVVFQHCPQICFLHPSTTKQNRKRIPFGELLRGNTCGVTAYKLNHIHNDFVLQVRYLPTFDQFMSCCRDRNTALYLGDLENKRKSYFRVRKGVYTFDYAKNNNTIVTGGKDMIVRVWNPYVPSKPVILMPGQKSAITYVMVHQTKEQVISISEIKDIMIFEMSSQICIQKISKKYMQLGPRPISAAYFNPLRQALVLATNQLAILEHKEEDLVTQSRTSHNMAVVSVLYNSLFDQIVSGGEDSIVNVWNSVTGCRVMQFVAHKKLVGGVEISISISTMNFDPTLRRLITAGRDGTVKIWNFNNGALLRTLDQYGDLEVTGIVCPPNFIITCGWNQTVMVHVDNKEEEHSVQWKHYHKDDILSLAFYPPNIVASGAFDGTILIWSLETAHVTMRFNAHESDKPLTMTKQGTFVKNKVRRVQIQSDEVEPNKDSALARFERQKQRMKSVIDLGLPKNEFAKENPISESLQKRQRLKSICKGPDDQETGKALKARASVCVPLFTRVNSTSSIGESDSFTSSDAEYRQYMHLVSQTLADHDRMSRTSSSAVESLVFLTSRPINPMTATLLAGGAKGWIRAWSVHHEGGLLGQFNAAHKPEESISCMATDIKNEYLITGDTAGYIKVWDLTEYCVPKKKKHDVYESRMKRYKKFPFMRIESVLRRRAKDQKKHHPPPSSSVPWLTLKVPRILNSFRAHLAAVTSISYIEIQECIITGSADCSVRLWSLSGQFIGIFGQQTPWKWPLWGNVQTTMNKPEQSGFLSSEMSEMHLPGDVRQVASATTLKVYYGGVRPLWKLARNIVMVWVPLLRLFRQDVADSKKDEEEIEISKSDEATCSLSPTPRQDEILGKFHRIPRKHQPLPVLPKVRQFQTQCSAFSSLPFYELEDVPREVAPPQTILEIQERNQSLSRRSRQQIKTNKV